MHFSSTDVRDIRVAIGIETRAYAVRCRIISYHQKSVWLILVTMEKFWRVLSVGVNTIFSCSTSVGKMQAS